SVALAGKGERSLYELDLRGRVALLVGNEGAGLSDGVLAAAKLRARIPLAGPVESLNAGTAGSIALFELLRQRTTTSRERTA
ncbi:MAG TPA: TrmH family RNA methyltransferase, partial [Usitatibacter sp.]|nr:TrmH family RNA methyltransferase [Usitatibacter sp.]